jgi:hypothetical protein
MSAVMLGMAPTVAGYAAQGACKFGFYEYFKSLAYSAVVRTGYFLISDHEINPTTGPSICKK